MLVSKAKHKELITMMVFIFYAVKKTGEVEKTNKALYSEKDAETVKQQMIRGGMYHSVGYSKA